MAHSITPVQYGQLLCVRNLRVVHPVTLKRFLVAVPRLRAGNGTDADIDACAKLCTEGGNNALARDFLPHEPWNCAVFR